MVMNNGSYKFFISENSSNDASQFQQYIPLSFKYTVYDLLIAFVAILSKILGKQVFEHHRESLHVAGIFSLILLLIN